VPEQQEEEDDDKKLSKTQLRRQRIKKKKEADEAADGKAKQEALVKQAQEKKAKLEAKKLAQEIEAQNKLKKQQQEEEDGWQTQKPKERKGPVLKPEKDLKIGSIGAERPQQAAPIDRVKGTIDVPKEKLGVIIGPKGETIKKIMEKTGTRINTPKEENFGPVIIEGSDERAVNAAKHAIESILKTGMSNVTHPGTTSGKVQLTDPVQIGSIIGKNGVIIQKLQKDLKVAIKVPDRDAVKLTVTITGAKEQVKQAKEAIENLIYLGYSKVTHPDWTSLEVNYPGNIGKLIGPRGQNIKSIQGNTGCRVNIPKPEHPNYKRETVILVGPPAKLESAKKQVLNTLVEKERYVEDDFGDPNDPNYEEPDYKAEDF